MAYTTIDDPSAHFQANAYSGSSNPQTITNDGNSDLQPDFLWSKRRDSAAPHYLFDSTRGVNSSLSSDDTDAVDTATGYLASFNSDGFTTGSDSALAYSGRTYVAWQWKANGGTTSSNSDGDVTSTVQANTTAGFSIVTYTGNGSDGGSIGHGLSGTWDVIIVKNRGQTDYWTVDRDASSGTSNALLLHDPSAESGHGTIHFRGSSGLFTAHSNGDLGMGNASSENYVAYVFKEVKGYSKFGVYKGNGNADGPFIYTGFKPAWVLGKNATSNGNHWFMNDNKRGGNGGANWIKADSDAAELTNLTNPDFVSNGFKIRNNNAIFNENNSDFFFMAFAEYPFVSSKGVPVTAG